MTPANNNEHPVMNDAPPDVQAAYAVIAAHVAGLPNGDAFGEALATMLAYAAQVVGDMAAKIMEGLNNEQA